MPSSAAAQTPAEDVVEHRKDVLDTHAGKVVGRSLHAAMPITIIALPFLGVRQNFIRFGVIGIQFKAFPTINDCL